MARFILIFTLFVFLANAANASAMLGCCEQKQEHSRSEAAPPCHQHTDNTAKTKSMGDMGGCLCTYMCTSQINLPDHDIFQSRIVMAMVPVYGGHDVGMSVILTPESPPPKS